ncbi:MAG: GNAT family N-acetyltransferase [Flavobacterium sp.]|uniref:GNAT family N-acetyltransferase n=1 Tax=Flavobacterium sp. TaxID=239 RepID=UPI001B14EA08|nr:GNAT family N-acetyltransferase [Flavobacterium sp.]MBO9584500.1 GNAT family N-acetyltransferase [Flavobacterium sp.]
MNTEILKYNPDYKNEVLSVWEKSVLATHLFLSEEDFVEIKLMLQDFDFAQLDVFLLSVDQKIVGFIGISDQKIEMLFLDPDYIGKGYGKQLVDYAFGAFDVNLVDVNEQNTNAIKFYEKIGFETYDRKELDDMGKNYPILKMKLKTA